ncbi:recombination-associated protein RdgC [Cupriavidus basilensis]|uniref:Recombination-associated protein RdgC n=1 Tax=Cupriavidus basilensis TaxID=68895 RepID=A0A0C4Y196_9BURK|nr:recombination-associated protein RdgC [Cupriavidus basilensis]AJG18797.1 DNA recombination-dependent growth factor C [Cupriavidus basilensis]
MWFRNLTVHRLSSFAFGPSQLAEALAKHAFATAGGLEMQAQGWISPRDNGELVHAVNGQMLIALCIEKKLLPASVVKEVVKARSAELESQQGFKPGRKQMRELKEYVTEELLPQAFRVRSVTRVWIDAASGWLVIDAGAGAKADAVRGMLFKSIDPLPLVNLHVNHSPVAAMTDWLATDEVPNSFTIDQDVELQSSSESKATVRYARHPVDADDMSRHIAAGKRCTRLAMTWSDRVSFILTDDLTIKRVAPLDVLKEAKDATGDADDAFDGDFLLMASELALLLGDLVGALGGERVEAATGQATEATSEALL